jgi:hypothetical protein
VQVGFRHSRVFQRVGWIWRDIGQIDEVLDDLHRIGETARFDRGTKAVEGGQGGTLFLILGRLGQQHCKVEQVFLFV